MGVTYINPYRFGFNPLSLSPALWLDASDASTITASAGAVSAWANKGSLGGFTQSTAVDQPTTGVSTLNNKNVIDFASDFMVAANQNEWKLLHDGTKSIIAAVWKVGASVASGSEHALMGNIGTSLDTGFVIEFDYRSSNPQSLLHYVTKGSSGQIVSLQWTSNNTFTRGDYHIVTLVNDPSNATAANRSEIYLNSGNARKSNTYSASPSTGNPSYALHLGASISQFTGGVPFSKLTGSIAELVIVSGANATEANRVALRDYLNAKWAVY